MSPKYGHFSEDGSNQKIYLNQANIKIISSWGWFNGSFNYSDLANGIGDLTWNSHTNDISRNQSDNDYIACTPFILDEGDYINGYRVIHTQYIWHLEFLTSRNLSYKCSSENEDITWVDTGEVRYPNHFLSGFVFDAGLIINGIQFQFTPIRTELPTTTAVLSQHHTSTPSQSPTTNPTTTTNDLIVTKIVHIPNDHGFVFGMAHLIIGVVIVFSCCILPCCIGICVCYYIRHRRGTGSEQRQVQKSERNIKIPTDNKDKDKDHEPTVYTKTELQIGREGLDRLNDENTHESDNEVALEIEKEHTITKSGLSLHDSMKVHHDNYVFSPTEISPKMIHIEGMKNYRGELALGIIDGAEKEDLMKSLRFIPSDKSEISKSPSGNITKGKITKGSAIQDKSDYKPELVKGIGSGDSDAMYYNNHDMKCPSIKTSGKTTMDGTTKPSLSGDFGSV